MHCFGVTVLGVLNQKHHEERDDCRGGVDDQLPGVRKMECGSRKQPNDNDKHSSTKRPGAAEHDGGPMCENAECVTNDAKKIALLLVMFKFFCLGSIRHVT